MTQETLQTYVNRKIIVVDAFGQSVKGTLQTVNVDSIVVEKGKNSVIISLDYIAKVVLLSW